MINGDSANINPLSQAHIAHIQTNERLVSGHEVQTLHAGRVLRSLRRLGPQAPEEHAPDIGVVGELFSDRDSGEPRHPGFLHDRGEHHRSDAGQNEAVSQYDPRVPRHEHHILPSR